MSDVLLPYYERELIYIRQLADEFARKHPAAAGRLLLEPNRSGDPHIERLIESFAFLAGRIHRKLDDEFPELTEALLGVLYPHYLAPVPSLGVVQFRLDPSQTQLPNGFTIARHSPLVSQVVGGLRCRFRTAYPVTLWPLECTRAQWQTPPFTAGLSPPPRTAAALRLQFRLLGQLPLKHFSLDWLRLALHGNNYVVAFLYELLSNHATDVLFRSGEPTEYDRVVRRPAAELIRTVGFSDDESLLPYPRQAHTGYRLLTEFFAFPQKFHFLDLGGWRLAAEIVEQQIEVVVFFNRTMKGLETLLEADQFRLGATPVVNLFEQVAEPIPLTQARTEYKIVPDVHFPTGKEVYSVDAVTSANPRTGITTEYQPFYSLRHRQTRDRTQAFWYTSRRPSPREHDRGTDLYLTLVDRGFSPRLPADEMLVIRTTCSNRDIPGQIQGLGREIQFELESAAPLAGIENLHSPSPALRPPQRRGAHWALLSHLSLNHLSLSDPLEGREALQEILRLYDFSDPLIGQQQLSEVTQQLIDGIAALHVRRSTARVGKGAECGMCRGLDITLELDETKYLATGMVLFGAVLERFFGLYASINSFTRLSVRTQQREGIIARWPARAGDRQLI